MEGTQVALDEFGQAAALQPGNQDQEVSNRATRYLVFAGDEPGVMTPGGMSVNTPCIPKRVIFRGQVTPCVSTPVWTRVEEIPEGQMLAGSDQVRDEHHPGKGKAAYLLYAGLEAANLLTQYGHTSDSAKQWGLVELKALKGLALEDVKALKVTPRFFPEYPKMPETTLAMAAQIEKVRDQIEASDDPHRNILLACADDMLTACTHAQEWQAQVAAESNMRVTLNPLDPGYKKAFDDKDKLFAKRAGIPLATNSMRGNQADSSTQLIEQIAKAMQPQAPQIDANVISAIVAATVQALREPAAAPAPEEKKFQAPPSKKVA